MTDRTAQVAAELARRFPNGPARKGAPTVDSETVRAWINYAAAALVAFVSGVLPMLILQLNGSDPINWRPIVASGLSALVAAGLGSRLPRPESAQIATQVNALKARGVPRHEMVVMSQDEAANALGSDSPSGKV
jgi:hypothetical protein